MIHYKDYYTSEHDAVRGAIYDRWVARCPVTGIELHASHGRSRNAPKWFVFAPDYRISHYRNYGDWRLVFRAWSTEEAIDHAVNNRKIQSWYRLFWQQEVNLLIGLG